MHKIQNVILFIKYTKSKLFSKKKQKKIGGSWVLFR